MWTPAMFVNNITILISLWHFKLVHYVLGIDPINQYTLSFCNICINKFFIAWICDYTKWRPVQCNRSLTLHQSSQRDFLEFSEWSCCAKNEKPNLHMKPSIKNMLIHLSINQFSFSWHYWTHGHIAVQ